MACMDQPVEYQTQEKKVKLNQNPQDASTSLSDRQCQQPSSTGSQSPRSTDSSNDQDIAENTNTYLEDQSVQIIVAGQKINDRKEEEKQDAVLGGAEMQHLQRRALDTGRQQTANHQQFQRERSKFQSSCLWIGSLVIVLVAMLLASGCFVYSDHQPMRASFSDNISFVACYAKLNASETAGRVELLRSTLDSHIAMSGSIENELYSLREVQIQGEFIPKLLLGNVLPELLAESVPLVTGYNVLSSMAEELIDYMYRLQDCNHRLDRAISNDIEEGSVLVDVWYREQQDRCLSRLPCDRTYWLLQQSYHDSNLSCVDTIATEAITVSTNARDCYSALHGFYRLLIRSAADLLDQTSSPSRVDTGHRLIDGTLDFGASQADVEQLHEHWNDRARLHSNNIFKRAADASQAVISFAVAGLLNDIFKRAADALQTIVSYVAARLP